MSEKSSTSQRILSTLAATAGLGVSLYLLYSNHQQKKLITELRKNIQKQNDEAENLSVNVCHEKTSAGSAILKDILLPGEKVRYLKPGNLADSFGPKAHNTPLKAKYENQLHHFQDENDIVTQSIWRNPDEQHKEYLRFLRAGPREKLYWEPKKVTAAIITCGGLCPGLNNVIRGLTQMLKEYGVRTVWGIKNGYKGICNEKGWVELDKRFIESIHRLGGSVLVSDRGNDSPEAMANALMKKGVNMFFVIGGDGSHRGAAQIQKEMVKVEYECSVVGVPKTIDNDIPVIDKTFGFATAVKEACRAIEAAYVESTGAPNCIGLVKLMGRHSGFVVMHAVCSAAAVDVALLPEMEIDLGKVLRHIQLLIKTKGRCVVVVAEGCGATMMRDEVDASKTDAGGNVKLPDVGLWLKDKIAQFAKANKHNDWNIKYIDPTYMIRAVPAIPYDSLYCHVLAHNAVHGAFAGYTGFSCGRVDMRYVMLPFSAITDRPPRQVNTAGRWFARMVMFTEQPCFVPDGRVQRHSSKLLPPSMIK